MTISLYYKCVKILYGENSEKCERGCQNTCKSGEDPTRISTRISPGSTRISPGFDNGYFNLKVLSNAFKCIRVESYQKNLITVFREF